MAHKPLYTLKMKEIEKKMKQGQRGGFWGGGCKKGYGVLGLTKEIVSRLKTEWRIWGEEVGNLGAEPQL